MWQLATKLKESNVKVAKLDADEHHEIAEEVSPFTGLPRLQEAAPPWDPTVGLRPGPYGGPTMGGGM